MNNNKKTWILAILLCLAMTITFFACGVREEENPSTRQPSEQEQETPAEKKETKFTVAVHNGGQVSIDEYAFDKELNLVADEVDGKTFVCWMKNGAVCSYDAEYQYFVAENAVFRAIYTDVSTFYLYSGEGTMQISQPAKVMKNNMTEKSDNTSTVFSISGKPEIVGVLAAGDTLTVNLEPLTGNCTTFEYEWQRSSTQDAEGIFVTVGSGETYVPTKDDIGRYLRVAVTGKEKYTGTVYSDVTDKIFSSASRNTATELVASTQKGDKTIAYGAETIILSGYRYYLPVPTQTHKNFEGWFDEEGNPYTDKDGKSLNVSDGQVHTLYARFADKETITIQLNMQVDGNVTPSTEPVICYLEDKTFRYVAKTVADHECTGWKDAEGNDVNESGSKNVLSVDFDSTFKKGETYTFTAIYKEAYRFSVSGGSGSGYYEGTTDLSVQAMVPAGKDFDHWAIKKNNIQYALAKKDNQLAIVVQTAKNVFYLQSLSEGNLNKELFFVVNNNATFTEKKYYELTFSLVVGCPADWEETKAFYFIKSGESYYPVTDSEPVWAEGRYYTVNTATLLREEPEDWNTTYNIYFGTTAEYLSSSFEQEKANGISVTPKALEQLQVPISGGCGLYAVYNNTDYILRYQLILGTQAKKQLSDRDGAGNYYIVQGDYTFTETKGDGVFICDVVKHYNEQLASALLTAPSVSHYNFDGWRLSGGGQIPATMPRVSSGEVLTIVGTYSAERFTISVAFEDRYGKAGIGSMKGGSSGSYEYGSTVNIYVTAKQGYQFQKWTYGENVAFDLDDPTSIVQQIGEAVTYDDDTMLYTFSYFVTGLSAQDDDKSIKVNFEPREYKIIYQLSLSYDGEDVTGNEFFLPDFTEYNGFTLKKTTTYFYYVLYTNGMQMTASDINAILKYNGFGYRTPDFDGMVADAGLLRMTVPVQNGADILTSTSYYRLPVTNGEENKYILLYPYAESNYFGRAETVLSPSNLVNEDLVGKEKYVLTKTEQYEFNTKNVKLCNAPTATELGMIYSNVPVGDTFVSYWNWKNGTEQANQWDVNFAYSSGDSYDGFSMPSKTVYATGVINIKSYVYGMSSQSTGVEGLEIVTVNGRDPENYAESGSGISIPYGSEVKVAMQMSTGYDFGAVKYVAKNVSTTVSVDIDKETGTAYLYYITFSFVSGQSTTYSFSTLENRYYLWMYVALDKENEESTQKLIGRDGLNLGSDSAVQYTAEIAFDRTVEIRTNKGTKVYTLYRLAAYIPYGTSVSYSMEETGGAGGLINLTNLTDASGTGLLRNCRYTFTSWQFQKEGQAGTVLSSLPVMPDCNVYAFTTLTLNMYQPDLLPISDENKKFIEDADKNDYQVEMESHSTVAEGDKYDYYTELVYTYRTPIGYTFENWQVQKVGSVYTNILYETAYASEEYVEITQKPADFDTAFNRYYYRKAENEEYRIIPNNDSIWNPAYTYAYLRYNSVREREEGLEYTLCAYEPATSSWSGYVLYATEKYTAIDEQPDDWAENYASYYVFEYIRNTSALWKDGERYAYKDGSGNYILLPACPIDWESEYASYYRIGYTKNSYSDWGTASLYGVAYRTFEQVAPMTEAPADWEYTYQNYYIINTTPAYTYRLQRTFGEDGTEVYKLYLRLTDNMTVSVNFGIKTFTATVVSLLWESGSYQTMSSNSTVQMITLTDGMGGSTVYAPEKVSFRYHDALQISINKDDLDTGENQGKKVLKITVYNSHNDYRQFVYENYVHDGAESEFICDFDGTDFSYAESGFTSDPFEGDVFIVISLGYIDYTVTYHIYTDLNRMSETESEGYISQASSKILTVTESTLPLSLQYLKDKFSIRYNNENTSMQNFLTVAELYTLMKATGMEANLPCQTTDSVLMIGWMGDEPSSDSGEGDVYSSYQHMTANQNVVMYGVLLNLYVFNECLDGSYAIGFNPAVSQEFNTTLLKQRPSLVLPHTYLGQPITCYGFTRMEQLYGGQEPVDYNFADLTNLCTLEPDENVATIEKDAVRNCANLTTLILTDGLQSIGENAFYGCEKLTEIIYPVDDPSDVYETGITTLQTIGKRAFYNTGLKVVKLPSSVKTIEEEAFANIKGLQDVYYNCKGTVTLSLNAGNGIFFNSGSQSKGYTLNISSANNGGTYYEYLPALEKIIATEENKPSDFTSRFITYQKWSGEYEKNTSNEWKAETYFRYVSYTETPTYGTVSYYYAYTLNKKALWQENTYFAKDVKVQVTEKPADWETEYASYITMGYVFNTSSVWNKNTSFYEYTENRYVLLENKPADWDEHYTNYYVCDRINGGISSLWNTKINTYYMQTSGYVPINVCPDDWGVTYSTYYTRSYELFDSQSMDPTGLTFFNPPYYEELSAKPSDWDTAYGTYFVKQYAENDSTTWILGQEYWREARYQAVAMNDEIWRNNYSTYYIGGVTLHVGKDTTVLSARLFGNEGSYAVENNGKYLVAVDMEESESTLEISAGAFKYSSVQDIYLSKRVSTLREGLFYGCGKLARVTFSADSAITYISPRCFYLCSALESLTLPSGVATIGTAAFAGTVHLSSVYYYENAGVANITKIEENAFTVADGKYSGLITFAPIGSSDTGVILPASLTTIGDKAFHSCRQITRLVIKMNQIAEMGTACFASTLNLAEIVYDVPQIVSTGMQAGLFTQGENGVACSVTVTDNVQVIPTYAFSGADAVTTLTIGRNVVSLGKQAFKGMTNLNRVYFNSSSLTSTASGEDYFYGSGNNMKVYVASNVLSVPQYLFYGVSELTSVDLTALDGRGNFKLGAYAFYNATNLTEVRFPSIENLTLEEGVFGADGNSSLAKVVADGTINTITLGVSVFYDKTYTRILLGNIDVSNDSVPLSVSQGTFVMTLATNGSYNGTLTTGGQMYINNGIYSVPEGTTLTVRGTVILRSDVDVYGTTVVESSGSIQYNTKKLIGKIQSMAEYYIKSTNATPYNALSIYQSFATETSGEVAINTQKDWVKVEQGVTLTVSAGDTLSVKQAFTLNGTLAIQGTVAFDSNAEVTLSAVAKMDLVHGAKLSKGGTVLVGTSSDTEGFCLGVDTNVTVMINNSSSSSMNSGLKYLMIRGTVETLSAYTGGNNDHLTIYQDAVLNANHKITAKMTVDGVLNVEDSVKIINAIDAPDTVAISADVRKTELSGIMFYKTLPLAIGSAEANDVFVIRRNCLSQPITVRKNITINVNGKELTFTANNQACILIAENGDLNVGGGGKILSATDSTETAMIYVKQKENLIGSAGRLNINNPALFDTLCTVFDQTERLSDSATYWLYGEEGTQITIQGNRSKTFKAKDKAVYTNGTLLMTQCVVTSETGIEADGGLCKLTDTDVTAQQYALLANGEAEVEIKSQYFESSLQATDTAVWINSVDAVLSLTGSLTEDSLVKRLTLTSGTSALLVSGGNVTVDKYVTLLSSGMRNNTATHQNGALVVENANAPKVKFTGVQNIVSNENGDAMMLDLTDEQGVLATISCTTLPTVLGNYAQYAYAEDSNRKTGLFYRSLDNMRGIFRQEEEESEKCYGSFYTALTDAICYSYTKNSSDLFDPYAYAYATKSGENYYAYISTEQPANWATEYENYYILDADDIDIYIGSACTLDSTTVIPKNCTVYSEKSTRVDTILLCYGSWHASGSFKLNSGNLFFGKDGECIMEKGCTATIGKTGENVVSVLIAGRAEWNANTTFDNAGLLITTGANVIFNRNTDDNGQYIATSVTFTGSSSVENNGTITLNDDIICQLDSCSWQEYGTVLNKGILYNNNVSTLCLAGEWDNRNTIQNNNTLTIQDGGTLINRATVVNNRTLSVEDGGTLENVESSNFMESGTTSVAGTIHTGNEINIKNTGTLRVQKEGTIVIDGTVSVNGKLLIFAPYDQVTEEGEIRFITTSDSAFFAGVELDRYTTLRAIMNEVADNYGTLEEAPDDWETNWTSYYAMPGVHLTGSVAPDFTIKSYYSRRALPGTAEEKESSYNSESSQLYVEDNDRFVRCSGEYDENETYYYFSRLTAMPNDWATSYADYFVRVDNEFFANTDTVWAYMFNKFTADWQTVDTSDYLKLLTAEPENWYIEYLSTYSLSNDVYVKNTYTAGESYLQEPDDWETIKTGLCYYDDVEKVYKPAGTFILGMTYYAIPTFEADRYYVCSLNTLCYYNLKAHTTTETDESTCVHLGSSYTYSDYHSTIQFGDGTKNYQITVTGSSVIKWDISHGTTYTGHSYVYTATGGDTTVTSYHRLECENCDASVPAQDHAYDSFVFDYKSVNSATKTMLFRHCSSCNTKILVAYYARIDERVSDINTFLGGSGLLWKTSYATTDLICNALTGETTSDFDGTTYYLIPLEKTVNGTVEGYMLVTCEKPTSVQSDKNYHYVAWDNGFKLYGQHAYALTARQTVNTDSIWKGYCGDCQTSADADYIVLYVEEGMSPADLKKFFNATNITGLTSTTPFDFENMTQADGYYLYEITVGSGFSAKTGNIRLALTTSTYGYDYISYEVQTHEGVNILSGEAQASEVHTLSLIGGEMVSINIGAKGNKVMRDIYCSTCSVCGQKIAYLQEMTDNTPIATVNTALTSAGYVISETAYASGETTIAHIIAERNVAHGSETLFECPLDSYEIGGKRYYLIPVSLTATPDQVEGNLLIAVVHDYEISWISEDEHICVCKYCGEKEYVDHTFQTATNEMLNGHKVFGYTCADCKEFIPYHYATDHNTTCVSLTGWASADNITLPSGLTTYVWRYILSNPGLFTYEGKNDDYYLFPVTDQDGNDGYILFSFAGHTEKRYSVSGTDEEKYFSDSHTIKCDGSCCTLYTEEVNHRLSSNAVWVSYKTEKGDFLYLCYECLDCGQYVFVTKRFTDANTYLDLQKSLPDGYPYYNEGNESNDRLTLGLFEGKERTSYRAMVNGYYSVPLCTTDDPSLRGFVLVKFIHKMKCRSNSGDEIEEDEMYCDICGYSYAQGHVFAESPFRVGEYLYDELVDPSATEDKTFCSESYERTISGYNESIVHITYDECNPFGMMAGDFGEITSLSTHKTQLAFDTKERFNNLGETLILFSNSREVEDYMSFINIAYAIYNDSIIYFIKKVNSSSKNSALVGINYNYAYLGSAESYPGIDAVDAIAKLFGFENKTDFATHAQTLATTYNTHYGEYGYEALENGCFKTENNVFVFPFAVKNELSSIVLGFVFLDSSDHVSVWVNDLSAVLSATNYNSSYYTNSTIKNEFYCKNLLFVTAPKQVLTYLGYDLLLTFDDTLTVKELDTYLLNFVYDWSDTGERLESYRLQDASTGNLAIHDCTIYDLMLKNHYEVIIIKGEEYILIPLGVFFTRPNEAISMGWEEKSVYYLKARFGATTTLGYQNGDAITSVDRNDVLTSETFLNSTAEYEYNSTFIFEEDEEGNIIKDYYPDLMERVREAMRAEPTLKADHSQAQSDFVPIMRNYTDNRLLWDSTEIIYCIGLGEEPGEQMTFRDVVEDFAPYGYTYLHNGIITDDTLLLDYLYAVQAKELSEENMPINGIYSYIRLAKVSSPYVEATVMKVQTNIQLTYKQLRYTDLVTGEIEEAKKMFLISAQCENCLHNELWMDLVEKNESGSTKKVTFKEMKYWLHYFDYTYLQIPVDTEGEESYLGQVADWESYYYTDTITEESFVEQANLKGSVLMEDGVKSYLVLYLGTQMYKETDPLTGKEIGDVELPVYLLLTTD